MVRSEPTEYRYERVDGVVLEIPCSAWLQHPEKLYLPQHLWEYLTKACKMGVVSPGLMVKWCDLVWDGLQPDWLAQLLAKVKHKSLWSNLRAMIADRPPDIDCTPGYIYHSADHAVKGIDNPPDITRACNFVVASTFSGKSTLVSAYRKKRRKKDAVYYDMDKLAWDWGYMNAANKHLWKTDEAKFHATVTAPTWKKCIKVLKPTDVVFTGLVDAESIELAKSNSAHVGYWAVPLETKLHQYDTGERKSDFIGHKELTNSHNHVEAVCSQHGIGGHALIADVMAPCTLR